MTSRLLPVLCALSLGACTKQGFLEAPKAEESVLESVGSFQTDTHFLLEPSADAEGLLGRAVQVTSKGGWTIADERAPGCQVRVKRAVADFEKSYRIGLGDMSALSAGYSELIKLEARYGRSVEAAMKVHNLETLTADIVGDCGEVVVTSVRVGTGERTLQRKAEAGGGGRVGKGPIGVKVGRDAATDVVDEMRWSSPQAYAFTYKGIQSRKVFEVQADVPEQVTEGDEINLRLTATDDAYLVIYYLDQNGGGGVLFPDVRLLAPRVKAGQTLVLPPDGDQPIQARLLTPGKPATDTLVIFAFASRGDFDSYKPGAFADGATDLEYINKLNEALSTVPISRWDRHTVTIDIQPKAATP